LDCDIPIVVVVVVLFFLNFYLGFGKRAANVKVDVIRKISIFTFAANGELTRRRAFLKRDSTMSRFGTIAARATGCLLA
jgi:hypothetical protein